MLILGDIPASHCVGLEVVPGPEPGLVVAVPAAAAAAAVVGLARRVGSGELPKRRHARRQGIVALGTAVC